MQRRPRDQAFWGLGFNTALPGENLLLSIGQDNVWLPLAVEFTFHTSAVAGNRHVQVSIGNGTAPTANIKTCTLTQPQNNTLTYRCHPDSQPPALAGSVFQFPMPSTDYCHAGDFVIISAEGMDAGDIFEAGTIYCRIWRTPQS